MIVVGIKNVVAKKSGYKFTELHCVCEDRFVRGMRCEAIFVRNDQISNIELLDIDSDITVMYNRFGRIESVVVSLPK